MAFFLVVRASAFIRRHEFEDRPDAAALVFGITTSVFLLMPFVIDGFFMERYLIPVLPFVMLALVAMNKRAETSMVISSWGLAPVGAITILVAYGGISIGYAHDYLLWNRVRWEAASFLVHGQGIEPNRIDGGLSFNGWYLFGVDGPLRKRYIEWRLGPAGWWRNEGADFVIGFSPLGNRDSVSSLALKDSGEQRPLVWRQSYSGWLPGADGAIVIHREPLSLRKAVPGSDSNSGGR